MKMQRAQRRDGHNGIDEGGKEGSEVGVQDWVRAGLISWSGQTAICGRCVSLPSLHVFSPFNTPVGIVDGCLHRSGSGKAQCHHHLCG